MDPLSNALALLRPRYLKTGAADVGGDLAVRVPAYDGLFCYAVLEGGCWLVLDGAEPVRLIAGDCVILPSGFAFRIASNPNLPPIDADRFFAERPNGGVAIYNGGGDCFLYAGHFGFDRRDAGMVLTFLPPIIHIREEDARATLRWSLERIMAELRHPRPGGDLTVEHLAHLILVEALRLHIAEDQGVPKGWLTALADPRVGTAIAAVQSAPAERWSVRTMAAAAGMSRTAFAVRFQAIVGMAPLAFVTRWRMELASDALRHSRQRVAEIAFSVGYAFEASFSTAFKKTMGCSPRRFA